MPERELIEFITAMAASEKPPWLALGIGDDAAVVEAPAGARIVLTADSVIEGVHVERGTPPSDVGRKAVARSLSDLAAMAARPLCTLATANFGPDYDDARCRELLRELWHAAARLGAPLVGGDVSSTSGPTSVSVTSVGTSGPGGLILRSGARHGDAVCVTGALGGSLRGRHVSFTPRIREAIALAERFDVHAMIDISDGLSTDALHLAERSGAGITLNAAAIPVSDDARAMASQTGRPPLSHALDDGEDYELLFCLSPNQAQQLAAEGIEGVPASVIGEVTADGESWLVLPDGRREPLRPGGWEHLRP